MSHTASLAFPFDVPLFLKRSTAPCGGHVIGLRVCDCSSLKLCILVTGYDAPSAAILHSTRSIVDVSQDHICLALVSGSSHTSLHSCQLDQCAEICCDGHGGLSKGSFCRG